MSWFLDHLLLTSVLMPNGWCMSHFLKQSPCPCVSFIEGKGKGSNPMTQATFSLHIYGLVVSHLRSPTRTDRKTVKDS